MKLPPVKLKRVPTREIGLPQYQEAISAEHAKLLRRQIMEKWGTLAQRVEHKGRMFVLWWNDTSICQAFSKQ